MAVSIQAQGIITGNQLSVVLPVNTKIYIHILIADLAAGRINNLLSLKVKKINSGCENNIIRPGNSDINGLLARFKNRIFP